MFPAMVIVPTLQICWTLFSILSGMLYFQEYQEMGWLQASMFCLGVAVSAHVARGATVAVLSYTPAAAAAADRKDAVGSAGELPKLLLSKQCGLCSKFGLASWYVSH